MLYVRDERPDLASEKLFAKEDPIGKFNTNCQNDKAVWTENDCGSLSKFNGGADGRRKCVVIKNIPAETFDQYIGNRYAHVLN